MTASFEIMKKKILTFALIETILLTISSLLWFFSRTLTLHNYSDKLFVSSAVAFCIGTLIVVTSTSRRHYYKHLQKKFKGVEKDDGKYDEERENRIRHSVYGSFLGGAGIVGIVISGVILYL